MAKAGVAAGAGAGGGATAPGSRMTTVRATHGGASRQAVHGQWGLPTTGHGAGLNSLTG